MSMAKAAAPAAHVWTGAGAGASALGARVGPLNADGLASEFTEFLLPHARHAAPLRSADPRETLASTPFSVQTSAASINRTGAHMESSGSESDSPAPFHNMHRSTHWLNDAGTGTLIITSTIFSECTTRPVNAWTPF